MNLINSIPETIDVNDDEDDDQVIVRYDVCTINMEFFNDDTSNEIKS